MEISWEHTVFEMGVFSLLPWARRNETAIFLTLVWLTGFLSLLKPMKADVKNMKTWCGRSELDHGKGEEEGSEVFCN